MCPLSVVPLWKNTKSESLSRFSTRQTFPCTVERLFLKQCTHTKKDFQFPRNSMTKNFLKYFQSCFSLIVMSFPSHGILKSCVRAFQRFDRLAP